MTSLTQGLNTQNGLVSHGLNEQPLRSSIMAAVYVGVAVTVDYEGRAATVDYEGRAATVDYEGDTE